MALQVSLIFLIIATIWATSPVSGASRNPSDCCLKTSDKEIPRRIVKCYTRQDLSGGCSIEAVVFITHKSRHLCAPTNKPWVKALMASKNKCPQKVA